MNALAGIHAQTRATHASSHAMSHERADTCGIVLKVERSVTRPATGSSRGLKCALLRARRRNRCRACGLARKRPCGHTRTDARNKRLHPRCLSSVLTRASSLSQSNALSLPRPTTSSARGLNSAFVRVCRHNADARAATHANALAATDAQSRATLAHERTVSRAGGHKRRRYQCRTHGGLRGRPPAAHAA